jgi:threonine/homoserine/homoserine lactone efflux protein
MPLKETPQSLRLYFGVIAAFAFYYAANALRQDVTSRLLVAMSIVNVAFGVLFAYIAVRFSYLLHAKPAFLKGVI